MTHTARPSTRPTPVTTPSAGRSVDDVFANNASSTNEPGSSSRSRRSRTNSLPCFSSLSPTLARLPASARRAAVATRSAAGGSGSRSTSGFEGKASVTTGAYRSSVGALAGASTHFVRSPNRRGFDSPSGNASTHFVRSPNRRSFPHRAVTLRLTSFAHRTGRSLTEQSGCSVPTDGQDGDVVVDGGAGEVPGRLEQRLHQSTRVCARVSSHGVGDAFLAELLVSGAGFGEPVGVEQHQVARVQPQLTGVVRAVRVQHQQWAGGAERTDVLLVPQPRRRVARRRVADGPGFGVEHDHAQRDHLLAAIHGRHLGVELL